MIYLDHNATTPVDARVLEEMLPWFSEKFGNAASNTHSYGWQAAEAVKIAREKIADFVGAEPAEIVFTSGATESVNTILKGVFQKYTSKGNHLIIAATEHKAVLDCCEYLEKTGAEITSVPVDASGKIDFDFLEKSIRPETVLMAVMMANNETGVIQDIRQISTLAKENGVLFFTDATQAIGKIPVNVQSEGIDLMAFSGHKIYGPKGVGVMYVRRKNPRVSLSPLLHGGGHENGFRSGTLNVPGIVGMGKAVEIFSNEMLTENIRIQTLRDHLQTELLQLSVNGKQPIVNGLSSARIPNSLSIYFPGFTAEKIISGIPQVAFSTGSACSSALKEPSHVLMAMGLVEKDAFASIRLSLGRGTTAGEIEKTIHLFREYFEKSQS